MKPNMNKKALDYALASAREFSEGAINGRAKNEVLSLAPGFSRVESGGGNEKTVLTVFLKLAILSEYQ